LAHLIALLVATACYDLGHFYFMAVVYKHIRKDTNEVFYIGIGKSEKRAYCNRGRNYHWKQVVNKAGYDIEIVEDELSWDDACSREKELIQFYGRADLNEGTLVNMTDGGNSEPNFSIELRKKLSELKTGKTTGRFGILNPQYGIPMTDEQKQKISASKKGKPQSEEHKKKMSESLKRYFENKNK
jgi:hypothetical protein